MITHAEPVTTGPEFELIDIPMLCSSARFCDRAGGAWDNTRASDNPEARKIAIQEVGDCPAGRLLLRDKDGQFIEPKFEPSIGVVFDPDHQEHRPAVGAGRHPDRGRGWVCVRNPQPSDSLPVWKINEQAVL